MIRKTYFYGIGNAGVEVITTWDDFADYHVQDEDVAIAIADTILVEGESWNEAPEGGCMEVYDALDTDALAEAVWLAKGNDPRPTA